MFVEINLSQSYPTVIVPNKALHSELLTELLGRFPIRNEYFVISEVWIWRHFFVIFGKFGISKFPKFPNIRKNQFPKLPNFFRTFSKLFPNFSELFPNFLIEKHHFFKIFEIYEIYKIFE